MRPIQYMLMGIVLIAGLSACTVQEETVPPPPAPAPAPEPVTPPPPPPKPTTQYEMEVVLYGMTEKQVIDKLAREADRVETEYNRGIDGYTQPSLTAWHYWDNPDGTGVRIGFVNDVVAEKEVLQVKEGTTYSE